MADTEKKMVSFRLSQDTKEEVVEYADEHDISQSEAFRRLVRKGKEVEESGPRLGLSGESSEFITDGGQIREEIAANKKQIKNLGKTIRFGTRLILSLLAILYSLDYFLGRPLSAVATLAVGGIVIAYVAFQTVRG